MRASRWHTLQLGRDSRDRGAAGKMSRATALGLARGFSRYSDWGFYAAVFSVVPGFLGDDLKLIAVFERGKKLTKALPP
jgi:hypothetical protein